MERLERFYKIDHLLKDRKVVAFSTLQNELGVTRATLKRDLDCMRDRFNAPIEYDREARFSSSTGSSSCCACLIPRDYSRRTSAGVSTTRARDGRDQKGALRMA